MGLHNVQARFPLLQRVEPDASVAATSSAITAGGPNRYLLPANNTGVVTLLLTIRLLNVVPLTTGMNYIHLWQSSAHSHNSIRTSAPSVVPVVIVSG